MFYNVSKRVLSCFNMSYPDVIENCRRLLRGVFHKQHTQVKEKSQFIILYRSYASCVLSLT